MDPEPPSPPEAWLDSRRTLGCLEGLVEWVDGEWMTPQGRELSLCWLV